MAKTITVIMGSPRKGNSDKLAQAFIDGAIEKGNTVYKVIVKKMRINGCIGCEYCYEHNGECIQKDDMQIVYAYLEKSDVIVFATPIYYQSFPSQLKALIDRLYVTENRKFSVCEAILLATYASIGDEMSKELCRYFRVLIDYMEWREAGIIVESGLDEVNDIEGKDVLIKAKELGRNI